MLGFLPIIFLVFSAAGAAPRLPLSGWEINQQWALREVEGAPQIASSTGFQATYANDEFEVWLKGTVLPDASTAKQKAKVELGNIQNLYKPRSNPYEGQVSDLIQCAPELMPKISPLALAGLAGGPAELLVGGATGRRMFGACDRNQVAYWAGYFQFYSEPQKMAVEVRVFYKKGVMDLSRARGKIKSFSERLFSKTSQVP